MNPTGVCWVKARASTLHYYHRWCIGEAADVNREKPAPKKKNKERKKNRVKNGWEENVRGNGRKRSNTIKENRAIWRCIGEGKDKATIKSSTTTPTATTKSCETANKIGAPERAHLQEICKSFLWGRGSRGKKVILKKVFTLMYRIITWLWECKLCWFAVLVIYSKLGSARDKYPKGR